MRYFEGKTAVSAQKSNIYMLHNKIKVNRACSSIRYNGIPHNGWSNIYWMFSTSNETIIDRVKSLAILTLLNQHYLHLFSRTPPNDCFYQGTNKFTANTAINSFTNTNITSVKRLVNRSKNSRFITAHNTYRFTNSFSTNRFTRRTNMVTTMCFT